MISTLKADIIQNGPLDLRGKPAEGFPELLNEVLPAAGKGQKRLHNHFVVKGNRLSAAEHPQGLDNHLRASKGAQSLQCVDPAVQIVPLHVGSNDLLDLADGQMALELMTGQKMAVVGRLRALAPEIDCGEVQKDRLHLKEILLKNRFCRRNPVQIAVEGQQAPHPGELPVHAGEMSLFHLFSLLDAPELRGHQAVDIRHAPGHPARSGAQRGGVKQIEAQHAQAHQPIPI